ncbi:MAG: insulinase family protein [Clostridia bacterium]|nr:insulinase family protein [Clostridia bacterium]
MSEWKELVCTRSGERCYYQRHASGLPVYVWPKENYSTTYAVFATRYGAIDTAFVESNATEPTVLPAGIAHYLEHKLFENEDCDAFERYAATGANANAYTSYDHTAYLFSCTQNPYDSLEILLDFVQSPYFTEQTVEKERGIIGQEIRMCEDSPSRRVFCNLMTALYHNHPVRIDIAGTVESIAEITPELLYGCYRNFYNLHNMVLVVAGNITCDEVQAVADRLLKPAPEGVPQRAPVAEPLTAAQPRIEVHMPVAVPLFYLGYKVPFDTRSGLHDESAKQIAAAQVLEELIGGKANPLYASLMEQGLINPSFEVSYFSGPGYGVWLMGGESVDPDEVCAAFKQEIARLKEQGIPPEEFETARNAVYGRMISQTDNVESCGDLLIEAHLCGRSPFSVLDEVASLDIQSVYDRLLTDFDEQACALSLVLPITSEV